VLREGEKERRVSFSARRGEERGEGRKEV